MFLSAPLVSWPSGRRTLGATWTLGQRILLWRHQNHRAQVSSLWPLSAVCQAGWSPCHAQPVASALSAQRVRAPAGMRHRESHESGPPPQSPGRLEPETWLMLASSAPSVCFSPGHRSQLGDARSDAPSLACPRWQCESRSIRARHLGHWQMAETSPLVPLSCHHSGSCSGTVAHMDSWLGHSAWTPVVSPGHRGSWGSWSKASVGF